MLTVPEILPPDECPKDLEILETVIERWVQQLADPNLDCAELDSQCESSPSSAEGSVGPDVPPDQFMVHMAFSGLRKVWRQWKPCRCLLSKLKRRLPFQFLIY